MISHILPIFIFDEILLVPSKSIESVVRRDILFFFFNIMISIKQHIGLVLSPGFFPHLSSGIQVNYYLMQRSLFLLISRVAVRFVDINEHPSQDP